MRHNTQSGGVAPHILNLTVDVDYCLHAAAVLDPTIEPR